MFENYKIVKKLSAASYLIEKRQKLYKLERFVKGSKLFNSISVHRDGIDFGLDLPEIFDFSYDEKTKLYQKVSEYILGETLDVLLTQPQNIKMICRKLGVYIFSLYHVHLITPVDNHFGNFVYTAQGKIFNIDMKKLQYRENNLLQIVKLCLKSCGGDGEKVREFLIGYTKRDRGILLPIYEQLEERNWVWETYRGEVIRTERFDKAEVL